MADDSVQRNQDLEPELDAEQSSPSSVVLFMSPGRNRELLSEALKEDYCVETSTDTEILDTDFDCCIFDYTGYNEVSDTLESIKAQSKYGFQPYVLLVKEDYLDWFDNNPWEHFDAVLEFPISKPKLLSRIGNLVERRRILSELIHRKRQLSSERDKLAAREEQLERQNEQLEHFAGIVSHDLRNPLKVAEGHLELAREKHDNEDLEKVAQALERMYLLIDDLLELARAGNQVSGIETVDLPALSERSWANIDTRSATLHIQTTRSIEADQSRLLQLLENLFRNAIEHGGENVSVTVGALSDGFFIEDDGEGIAEADRDEIFEIGQSSNPDGTGFGLSIVRDIAEAHGWNVTLTESNAGGARFEFTDVTTQ